MSLQIFIRTLLNSKSYFWFIHWWDLNPWYQKYICKFFLKTNSNGSWQPWSFLMVFFIQCKNCMSVEKISLESGKLSVFKVHFILSVAKLYYYCCELARRVSLGCKWPHITTRDRLFAILASEKNAFTLPAWKVSMKTKRSKF